MWRDYLSQLQEIIRQQGDNVSALLEILEKSESGLLNDLCFSFLKAIGVRPKEECIMALAMAGALGELPNTLPYHGNHHYRKVVVQLTRLIEQHQKTGGNLDDEQIVMLLIAACVHDLGHEGKASFGIPGDVEQKSFDMAKPYLAAAGLNDEVLTQINVMLLCTDVQPIGNAGNPTTLTKAVYRYHYEGADLPKLPAGISVLADEKDLTLMALMLHEADIATSAGIDYETTIEETRLFRQELTGGDDARPSHVVGFLNDVCGREMVLPAAKALYQPNMDLIFKVAHEAVEAGDLPFAVAG